MSTQSVLRRAGLRAAAITAASTHVLVGVAGLLLGLIGLGLGLRRRTAKP